jgi:hypothetical protein
MFKKSFLNSLFLTALTAFTIVGCGGGGGPSITAPVISAQPASVSVYDSQNATFTVTATDANPITYQWKKNGVDVVGETNSTFVLKSAVLADNSASITVAVSGKGGTTISSVATLTVISRAPIVTTNPTPQSVVAGQSATFTVSVSGLAPFTYQWFKNGQAITGATSSSYSTPVTLGDNLKQYSVQVTNSVGSATSAAAAVNVQASTLTNLVISEVSTCYYYASGCWFEIYNPTSIAINLSAYSVRSIGFNVSSREATDSQVFNLPNLSIPSDGYLIISGNSENLKQRGSQNIRLRSGNNVPLWGSYGFIELLNGGSTVDFVKFGSSTQAPTTSGKWTGSAVAALPYSADDYGRSIVRPYPKSANTNTYSSADWILVDWVTPAGRNDVPFGAKDEDKDGIPDSAEVVGGTFAGIDLYSMGARTGKRDIFIELDRMDSTDAGINPIKESLQMVVKAFASKEINVVFDAGNSFSQTFSVDNFNLNQGSNIVPYEKCVTFDQTTCSSNTSDKRSIYDWKEENMDLRRRSIFHYLLMANSQKVDGAGFGSSGLAEFNGNDLIVTIGSYYSAPSNTAQFNYITNFQALTIMHELGHNLGLKHGGDEDINYKPNYWSIMNYVYTQGLDPDPTSIRAYQRWRNSQGDKTPLMCDLFASICGKPSEFIINYSDGKSSPLDENALLESANIGRGSNSGAYADWNLSGTLNSTAISKDLNGDGIKSILKDYDDWSNIKLPFARSPQGNSGPSINNKSSKPLDPVSSDRQEYIVETFQFKAPR